jgi:hypothetical protein
MAYKELVGEVCNEFLDAGRAPGGGRFADANAHSSQSAR